MYYVSGVSEPFNAPSLNETVYNKIQITDSDSGSVDVLSNKSALQAIKKYGFKIYGTYCYGSDKEHMYVFATPQKFGVSADVRKLQDLCNNHRIKHNPWSEYPIADYLASLEVNTILNITGSMSGNYDDPNIYKFDATITKVGSDKWYVKDDNIVFGNTYVNSYAATHILDVYCCGSIQYKIKAGKRGDAHGSRNR